MSFEMLDQLIVRAQSLPWLVQKLNRIKNRCKINEHFADYFLKDLLREFSQEANLNGVYVGSRVPSEGDIAKAKDAVVFLENAGVTIATRLDDAVFASEVDDLVMRLRSTS